MIGCAYRICVSRACDGREVTLTDSQIQAQARLSGLMIRHPKPQSMQLNADPPSPLHRVQPPSRGCMSHRSLPSFSVRSIKPITYHLSPITYHFSSSSLTKKARHTFLVTLLPILLRPWPPWPPRYCNKAEKTVASMLDITHLPNA